MTLEEVLQKAQAGLTALLGEQLLTLLVYGSAATGEHQQGISDINLLLVLKTIDLNTIDQVRGFLQNLRGHRLATPLLMTPEYIRSSLDIFPIEFFEIQEKHQLLWGEDFFKPLTITTENLRHECEHELKGRLMRMRQSYLETGQDKAGLRQLLLAGHSANFPAFRTLIRMKKGSAPVKKTEIEKNLHELFGLDLDVFEQLRQLRLQLKADSLSGLRELLEKYLLQVAKLADVVDRF